MAATPGTQIGVDGRRVPVGELPALSAEEFIEQQRLEMLRLAEPLAEAGGVVVGKAARTTRQAIAWGTLTDLELFDLLVDDPDLTAELEANAVYAVEVGVPVRMEVGASFIYQFSVPEGASGTWRDIAGQLPGVFVESDDPGRAKIDLGTPRATDGSEDFDVEFMSGHISTVAAGTFAFRWHGMSAAGGEDVHVDTGAWLRLTRIIPQ